MARNLQRDLTQGSPMKLLIGFSLPLLGGFLFQQLYSFIDTAIVGRFLGYDALAAVGSTGSLNFLINGFCMGLCSGFAIPIAQAKGAQDDEELRRFGGAHHAVKKVKHYISRLPSIAFARVTSSAYSRSLPTGTPRATGRRAVRR